MTAADCLLALAPVKRSPEAFAGAMLVAEFFAIVRGLTTGGDDGKKG